VKRYPKIVDEGIYFGRPVAFDSSALFLIKVAEARELSTSRRERFLDLLAEQVTGEGDFGFLDHDPDFESFLTEVETTRLRNLAHDKATDGLDELADIPQMTSKFVEIVPLVHRQGYGIPSAAIR